MNGIVGGVFSFMKPLVVALILATMPLSTMSYQSALTKLTEQDNGATVSARVRTRIVLRLTAQLGTGYSWQIEHISRGLRLEAQSQESASSEKVVGGPDVQVFQFRVLQKG